MNQGAMTETTPSTGAFYLGLLDEPRRAEVERLVRSDPEVRGQCVSWPNAAAAITCGTLIVDRGAFEARLEQRLIQRARVVRPPSVRSHRTLRVARRGVRWLLLVGLVAVAIIFGVLAFRADEPISGRAIALNAEGTTGVLLPKYEERLFALIFWGLPELSLNETWQLWLVRESGAVEPGPTFSRDDDGRAAITIDPNTLESDDELIGFVVSRDDPSARQDGTPSSDDILYQFSRR